jgi:hypothetical protein
MPLIAWCSVKAQGQLYIYLYQMFIFHIRNGKVLVLIGKFKVILENSRELCASPEHTKAN